MKAHQCILLLSACLMSVDAMYNNKLLRTLAKELHARTDKEELGNWNQPINTGPIIEDMESEENAFSDRDGPMQLNGYGGDNYEKEKESSAGVEPQETSEEPAENNKPGSYNTGNTSYLSERMIEAKVSTANEYLYHPMYDYGVSISQRNSVTFQVQACNDAHVLLMKYEHNFNDKVYEIVIGGWGNSKSVIRKVRQGSHLSTTYHSPLNCNHYRSFWISWYSSTIMVGTGDQVGQNEFMSYTDWRNPTAVNYLAVSTGWGANGRWIFTNVDA